MLRGSATSDGKCAYFAPYESRQVYKLEWSTEKWEELPPCYYHDSGLVVMNGELISVGGAAGNRFSLYVFTLGYPQLWINTSYPPMNTPRSSPAVLAVPGGDSALVIGGCVSTDRWTRTVEMYQVESREWSLVADLPQSLTAPSATLCAGDVVHVIGYEGIGFSCPLGALLTGGQAGVWKPLPALPVTHSTAATLCGQLVLVGGRAAGSTVKSIYQLLEGRWVEIGSMASQRERCLAVSVSPDKLLIVSGVKAWDNVEECSVV